ncbi:unnamed protein product [Cuscuta campestris]|uniref:Uncharacterized protein n=1 Tax=Cuscuta campestris TaxID=132261 RepID=A0A484KE31_9ASTE|nr:unnamed protein product [Cuscuta campestris]
MARSRRVTTSSAANAGGGLRMTFTTPIGACQDDLDVSINDVTSQNTTDLRHRIPRRRAANVGGSQEPTQQVPVQSAGVLTQPPNGLVRKGGMVLPSDFSSPLFQFDETSGVRAPGVDPSGFWAMMRAMIFNQPMTGFQVSISVPQPTFQPEGRREGLQNVAENTKLFAHHLKGLMTDSRLGPLTGEHDKKESSCSKQRDNGKVLERRVNKKQTSRRDRDTASKHREPLKVGQDESESHVSMFSRMWVPATDRLHGRRNAFTQDGAGKTQMLCEERCERHREAQPDRIVTNIQISYYPIV